MLVAPPPLRRRLITEPINLRLAENSVENKGSVCMGSDCNYFSELTQFKYRTYRYQNVSKTTWDPVRRAGPWSASNSRPTISVSSLCRRKCYPQRPGRFRKRDLRYQLGQKGIEVREHRSGRVRKSEDPPLSCCRNSTRWSRRTLCNFLPIWSNALDIAWNLNKQKQRFTFPARIGSVALGFSIRQVWITKDFPDE